MAVIVHLVVFRMMKLSMVLIIRFARRGTKIRSRAKKNQQGAVFVSAVSMTLIPACTKNLAVGSPIGTLADIQPLHLSGDWILYASAVSNVTNVHRRPTASPGKRP
jgi:hypothetical protein